MGVTITCKKTGRSCDLGMGGFMRFRERVAMLHSKEFGEHYARLCSPEGIRASKEWHDEFDRKTVKLLEEKKAHIKVVDFCLQSDCGGKIRYGACKVIYQAIKDYDDDIVYGYAGRPDRAMFADLKAIIKDCAETKSDLVWW